MKETSADGSKPREPKDKLKKDLFQKRVLTA